MTKREFNKLLNGCCTKKGGLNVAKLRALPLDQRQAMGHVVVRYRGPVLVELVEGLDPSWLAAMGYLTKTTSPSRPDLTFYHTSESRVR